MIQEKQTEPPSWLRSPLFMLGQDLRGNWVVREQKGALAAVCLSIARRHCAFIRTETGRQPQAIVMVSGILELDTGCEGNAVARADSALNSQPFAELVKYDEHREKFGGQDVGGCGACRRMPPRSGLDRRDARVGVLATIARGVCRSLPAGTALRCAAPAPNGGQHIARLH